MNTIRLVHLADIHLGFTGPTNFVLDASDPKKAGRYVREVDIEEAVERLRKTIINAQPSVDVVVLAGDLFHRPVPYPRANSCAARFIHSLIDHDIAVVIIDGNHETASVLHIGSPTSLLKELGARVVNGASYRIIRDSWKRLSSEKQHQLTQLAIHALPYGALRDSQQFTGILPLSGYINVLLAHGRVSGMNDFNSLHRTAQTIPTEILYRGWDYVALGDWHIHRHQPLPDVPAYYAGSLEALNFGEAALYPPRRKNSYAVRGAIDVRLEYGKQAVIQTLPNQDARPVLRLDPIDATNSDADMLMETIHQRLTSALPPHALVLLEINNCSSQTYEQLNHAEIAELRQRVLRCDIRFDVQRPISEQGREAMSEATLDSQWTRFLESREQDEAERSWYVEQGMARIEEAKTKLRTSQLLVGE